MGITTSTGDASSAPSPSTSSPPPPAPPPARAAAAPRSPSTAPAWPPHQNLYPRMSSPPASPAPSNIPEAPASELPLTLAASVVLTALPRDGKRALDAAAHPPAKKVSVRFQAIGNAPQLNTRVFKCKTTQRFESVVVFLRKELGVKEAEGVFAYVNSSFAPAGDESVGGLWDCFKVDDCLIVCYSMTPAFG